MHSLVESESDSELSVVPSDSGDTDFSDTEEFHGVSMVATAFNISKGIVGEGILSLPAGIAAGTGVFPALVVMTLFYLVMMYSFWSIGRCCEATCAKSHGEVGRVICGNNYFGGVMEVTNLLKTTLTCTAYALVIGKNSEDVWKAFGVEKLWFMGHRESFLVILVLILLPLCLLRGLSKLAFSSIFGLVCEVGVVIFMVIRLFTGEYRPGGDFYNSQAPGTQLSWGDRSGPELFDLDLSVFVLISSMSTAFLAHYNSPKFYHQLRRRSSKSFLKATAVGYTMAFLLFATCMVVGYLTFGKSCAGNILHNYSHEDSGATVSRVAMLLATICGFPIAFTGLRTATLMLFACSSRKRVFFPVTFLLLAIIGVLGATLNDLGIVNSLGGATLGSLIELIYPGIMIMWTYKASQRKDSMVTEAFSKFEGKHVSRLLAGFGVAMFCFGTCIVLAVKVFHVEL